MDASWKGIVGLVVGAFLPASLAAQVTQQVHLSSAGVQGNSFGDNPALSADGRFVAFASAASNLVPGDANGYWDVFLRDRDTGTTERVSVGFGGAEPNGPCSGLYSWIDISADGRYVVFPTQATNLVSGGNGIDVVLRDRQLGTNEIASRDSAEVPGNAPSHAPVVSADGRFVAFESQATNLVAFDINDEMDVFVRDRQLGITERVSVNSVEAEAVSGGRTPAISGDGRFVAFGSLSDDLVAGDTNAVGDVFVRDRQLGTTERVSLSSGGAQGDGHSGIASPAPDRTIAISGDGRFVAFTSVATNLVAADTNGIDDIFVRDRQLNTTVRASVDSAGAQGSGFSVFPAFSGNGRYVAFWSDSSLAAGDNNGAPDVFVRDLQTSTTALVSVNSQGALGNAPSTFPAISPDGRYVAFSSNSSNLVPGDTNGWPDVFVRDRTGGTDFTSLCDPGQGGVQPCPCGNPPSGAGRGCNNSSATGGAVLSASGGTFLSSDSVVFATSGEKPTALSILLQGTTSPPAGLLYGQGVRCVAGSLERLFTKSAVAGSITAPDFGAGDPTVSARSAAKGDTIGPGQSRWYLVFYRDPTVLGGCPATSTFNATQTGRITWSP